MTVAAVTSPLAVCASSSASSPLQLTSADAVRAWQREPSGSVIVTSNAAWPRNKPVRLGPATSSRPWSKVTRTSSISFSAFRLNRDGATSTVVADTGRASRLTRPEARSAKTSIGSEPGNSQLGMVLVRFVLGVLMDGTAFSRAHNR